MKGVVNLGIHAIVSKFAFGNIPRLIRQAIEFILSVEFATKGPVFGEFGGRVVGVALVGLPTFEVLVQMDRGL